MVYLIFQEKKRIAESGEGPQSPEENTEEKVITIRPLKMEDFREAKNRVLFLLLSICFSRVTIRLRDSSMGHAWVV